MQLSTVYLICGVPGSGKTWVCKQLTDKFRYIPHDEHYKDFVTAIVEQARESLKPIITECPFNERPTREELEKRGIKVIPYFVIETPRTVQQRYYSREKKHIPKNFVTRAYTIISRAEEWKAPHGNSEEVLKMLQDLPV